MPDLYEAFRMFILAALGYAPDVITPGKLMRFSTSNRRGDTAGWCKLFDDLRSGVYGCFRQGISGLWSAIPKSRMTPSEQAALRKHIEAAKAERTAVQRELWAQNARLISMMAAGCRPLALDDPATRYLHHRLQASPWPMPPCLRFHPAVPYWHAGLELGRFPALVAPLVSPHNAVVALHRTYLTLDGRKADVPVVKKLTGAAGPLAGAAIRLHKPLNGELGVAEGIETALAAWLASGVPTVATYCASAMASFKWPQEVQRLIVFADADEAGQRAALALKARAANVGVRCDVVTPSVPGMDWCDMWAARGGNQIDMVAQTVFDTFEPAHRDGGGT